MELKKLFQVLVVGGSLIGVGTACDATRARPAASDPAKDANGKDKAAADAGTTERSQGGGGVEGW